MAGKIAERQRNPKTASDDEVARFSAIADDWWDPSGKFRPLHQIAPVRLRFIRDRAAARFGRDPLGPAPLDGLKVLDIGCGGGLLSEPMRRLGASVTGIDAGRRNIEVAAAHAAEVGLDIDYRNVLPEDLARGRARFDLVLNMEVIEHVADVGAFMDACARLVKPGGAMVLSTLNRTVKSLAMAKIGAEYILRWLPVGTHDWRKFLKPSELAAEVRAAGMEVAAIDGMRFDPIADEWRSNRDVSVNYMMFAVKPD